MKLQPILLLASSSPRRLALLHSIDIYPQQILNPQIDETPLHKEKPARVAERLAREKAMIAARQCSEGFILAADTIVGTASRIFDKAHTNDEVAQYLQFFSGKKIHIYTAIAVAVVIDNQITKLVSKLVVSKIKFKRFAKEEIAHYLKSNNGIGIAGGFVIQGLGETLIQNISGSYSSIIGLPLAETISLLKGLGYDPYHQSKSKD